MTWKIDNRIADPEHGYPQTEARFASVKEWEAHMYTYGFVYGGWPMALGRCGSADCMLQLLEPAGKHYRIHEYGIGSDEWEALSEFWHINEQHGFVPIGRVKEILEMNKGK